MDAHSDSAAESEGASSSESGSSAESLGHATHGLPRVVLKWLSKLRRRAANKTEQSLLSIPSSSIDLAGLRLAHTLDAPWDRSQHAIASQHLYSMKQRQRTDAVLREMTALTTPLKCVRFDEGNGAIMKYYHNRVCVGRKGVGLVVARRRKGDAMQSPPMADFGFHEAPGRRLCSHEGLFDLVNIYKHTHNALGFVLALHSALGEANGIEDYFGDDKRFMLPWVVHISRLERNLLLPDEELASLLVAVYVGAQARPALESYVEDNHMLNSEVVCHDGTYKFMRTFREATNAAAPRPANASTRPSPSLKRPRRTPGGQAATIYTRSSAAKNTNFQLALSSDGRLLGFHAFAGETRYSQCCAHFEVLRRRCKSVLLMFPQPTTLFGVRVLIERTNPFGVLTDGFPPGGIFLATYMFMAGIESSFTRAMGPVAEHAPFAPAYQSRQAPPIEAPILGHEPVKLEEDSFVAAIQRGDASPLVAEKLTAVFLSPQQTGASFDAGPIMGTDWRHPVWTHRTEHLTKRHPLRVAFGNMFEHMLKNLAAPPWQPDLRSDFSEDTSLVWRLPEDVASELLCEDGASKSGAPESWYGRVWGWARVWAMWKQNELRVAVAFLPILPQSLFLAIIRKI